jgi:type I restriction enzyme M protein
MLVVDDRWLATGETDVSCELDRISQGLTGRVRQLAERYSTSLPHLVDQVIMYSTRVANHFRQMGASWQ